MDKVVSRAESRSEAFYPVAAGKYPKIAQAADITDDPAAAGDSFLMFSLHSGYKIFLVYLRVHKTPPNFGFILSCQIRLGVEAF